MQDDLAAIYPLDHIDHGGWGELFGDGSFAVLAELGSQIGILEQFFARISQPIDVFRFDEKTGFFIDDLYEFRIINAPTV